MKQILELVLTLKKFLKLVGKILRVIMEKSMKENLHYLLPKSFLVKTIQIKDEIRKKGNALKEELMKNTGKRIGGQTNREVIAFLHECKFSK